MQINADSLTLMLIIDLSNPRSAYRDIVQSFKSFRSIVFVLLCQTQTPTTYPCTYIHQGKLIAMSAPPNYVIGANNNVNIIISITGTTVDDDDACLRAVFQDNPGKPVPECLHSGFYWS